jgi:hypothetical protein
MYNQLRRTGETMQTVGLWEASKGDSGRRPPIFFADLSL